MDTAIISKMKSFLENLVHYSGAMQIFTIGIICLIGWFVSRRIRRYLEEAIKNARFPQRILLKSTRFSHVTMLLLSSQMLWFALVLFKKIGIPADILHAAVNLVVVALGLYFAYHYIQNKFWSRSIIILCLLYVVLTFFHIWAPFLLLLDGMSMSVGHIDMSLLDVGKSLVTFIVLWSLIILVDHIFSFLFSSSSRMTYSDQLLIQRAFKTASAVIVILITLGAAGIHPAALAVTGGAIGFSIGVGLQKIGSNLVSGIALLIRKPVTQGDFILLEKPSGGASYTGKVQSMGLLYVHLETRDATKESIPNELFMTHKVKNISYRNNLLRLHIPLGISYDSDAKNAIALAEAASKTVGRVLGTPEPKCLLMGFGDSSVNLELRLWINDPDHGISSAKSEVFLAVYDSFRANGIEIPFPQRDLHIKSAVPLPVSDDRG